METRNSDGASRPVNINFKSANQSANFMPQSGRMNIPSRSPEAPHATQLSPEKNNKFIAKVFDRIIGLSIFMLFFGLPLYFTGTASQGIIFEKQIWLYFWLLLGLIVWVAKGVMVGEMNIRRTPLDWPILGFWLAYLAAAIFSIDRWHSFWGAFSDPSRGMASITAFVIAYYFIFSNFSGKRLKLILTAILSSGFILSLWTALAVMGVKFLPEKLMPYAPLSLAGSITTLGIIFSCLIPLITVAILKIGEAGEMKKIRKNILLGSLFIFLALDLFLILALYNYVPWVGFFTGIAIFLIFILAKIIRPNPSFIWLPIVVSVSVMIIGMTDGVVSIARVSLPVEVSLNYKTSASIAMQSLKNNFLVGSGPGTYGYDFSLNRPQEFNLNAFYNLRFLQGTGILAEAVPTIGAIGAFFLVVIFLSYLGSQFYLLYKDKEKNKLYSLGIFSAAVILVVNILTVRTDGVALAITVLFATFALAAAMLESEGNENNFSLSLKASPKFALALAFVFMVVSAGVAFLFVYLGKIYAADAYAGRAAIAVSKDPDRAMNYLGKAISLNKQESKYYSQAGQYYMALANQEAAKNEDLRDADKIKQYLNNSIVAAGQAKNMSQHDVNTVELLALIYENAGLYVPDSFKLAEENYAAAQALEPHNPVYFIKLGQIKIAMAGSEKDAEKKKQLVSDAKNIFQKSVDEKNNYSAGYYQLSLAHEALNELDQAIENGLKAVQLDRRNANQLLSLGRMYEGRNKNEDLKSAEQAYKAAISLDDKNVNGHFYLGLLYEEEKNKDGAKSEYNKVLNLLQSSGGRTNGDTVGKLKQMIDNVDRGIKNTPESLGMIKQQESAPAPEVAPVQPANSPAPTLEQAQPAEQPANPEEQVQP